MSAKILLVDDEAAIADLVEVYLTNEGYTVYKCENAAQALECVAEKPVDLAILDVMLPDLSGFELCRRIRKKHLWPILMLTARVEDLDKIQGLMLGADDYITKPLCISEVTHKCTLYGEELALTPLEFSILWYLCSRRGQVVPSEQLFQEVWGEKYIDGNNTVMTHIARLREKMHEKSRQPKFIKTVWGVGYTIE